MKNYTQNDIKILFSNLCCSHCKNDFDKNSIEIKEHNEDLIFANLKCQKCGKDFGDIIFNFNRKSNIHLPLEAIEGPPPINADDVLNAHEFIKKNL